MKIFKYKNIMNKDKYCFICHSCGKINYMFDCYTMDKFLDDKNELYCFYCNNKIDYNKVLDEESIDIKHFSNVKSLRNYLLTANIRCKHDLDILDNGIIALPIIYREFLGLSPGDEVEIELTSVDTIQIKKKKV